MIGCILDPLRCAEAGFWSLVGLVPWWGWILALIVAAGVLWRVAGWPGLIALSGVIGFALGRRSHAEPDWETGEPKPRARRPVRRSSGSDEPPQSLSE